MLTLPLAKHPATYLGLLTCASLTQNCLESVILPEPWRERGLQNSYLNLATFPFSCGEMTFFFSFFNSKNCFRLGRVGGMFVLENIYRHMESYRMERKEISVSPKKQRSHKTQSLFRDTLMAGRRPVLQDRSGICVRLDYEQHLSVLLVVSLKSPPNPAEHLVGGDPR